jgi:hypothetical protein
MRVGSMGSASVFGLGVGAVTLWLRAAIGSSGSGASSGAARGRSIQIGRSATARLQAIGDYCRRLSCTLCRTWRSRDRGQALPDYEHESDQAERAREASRSRGTPGRDWGERSDWCYRSTGVTGATGAGGPQGVPGIARAYACIGERGEIKTSSGFGGASVSTPYIGEYCISGLSFTPAVAVATPDISSVPTSAQVEVLDSGSCQVKVYIYSADTGPGEFTTHYQGFYVMID